MLERLFVGATTDRSHARGRGATARALLCAAALSLLGCPKQELAPLGPCTVSAAARRVDQSGTSKVDLLFVIDNSGSMATEQLKLAAELPRLVQVLTTGDRNAGRAPGAGMGGQQEMFTPVSSLHLGVVSTNMGGIDAPSGDTPAALSCQGLGDDGKLLRSSEIATMGVIANTNFEFPGYRMGEAVLPPDPECQGRMPPKYQTFEVGGQTDAQEVATAFRCVSKLGVRGCSYEQQLEAMWKALAPSDGKSDFLDGTSGHGDPKGFNAGFVRDDAILAIIHVSDEEDCSIKDEGKVLFEQTPEANTRFGMEVNLRCGRHGEAMELVWPTTRYIQGLRSLKPSNPDLIIFAGIVGIPVRANGMPFDQILNMPEMQFRPGVAGQPAPSCSNTSSGRREEAYPPRRFLEVAKGFGSEAVIYSICADDYAPALDTLIDRIATKLSGNCLPRRLKRDRAGTVQCDVYELLPKGETKCVAERGHVGKPIERMAQAGREERRLACKMKQVPVVNERAESGETGWYYDDFSDQVQNVCPEGEQQRILFSFGELPEGASATFECLQPITSIDPTAKGFEAVNSLCPRASDCRQRSDSEYQLACIEGSCQISCENSPDCPPGWVCDRDGGGTAGPKYCQQPTCPSDDSTSTMSGAESSSDPAPRADAGRTAPADGGARRGAR
jgi:hypothetical protein